MAMIDNDWLQVLSGEFKKPYYRELYTFVKEEYNKALVYPPSDDIFNAFHFTPLSKVKVLILGQDPYHNTRPTASAFLFRCPKKKFLLPCKIFTRNWRRTAAVIFQITAI